MNRMSWTLPFAMLLAVGCGGDDAGAEPAGGEGGETGTAGAAGTVSGASGHATAGAGGAAAGHAGAASGGKGGTAGVGATGGKGGSTGGATGAQGGTGGASAGAGPVGTGGSKASGGSGQAGKGGQGGTSSSTAGAGGTKASGGSGQAGTGQAGTSQGQAGTGQAGTGQGQAGTGQGQAGSTSTSAYDCPGDAGDPFAAARKECVKTINDYRATLSLPPFKRWCGNATCEDSQPMQDAAKNQAHSAFGQCMEWAQNECPGWPDSPLANIDGCLKMMWDEGPGSDFSKHGHYINMSSTKYTMVECGFAETGGGKWWGVQDFK